MKHSFRIFTISILFTLTAASCAQQQVAIIGTGYVGLIIGAGLASCGHAVICVDTNQEKMDRLRNAQVPMYEPGLENLIREQVAAGRLTFTCDGARAIKAADIIMITVGTPMSDDGQANLGALNAVARMIGAESNGYKVVCIKSTVPLGTYEHVCDLFEQCEHTIDVVMNPEFFREGSALSDFFDCNNIIAGCASDRAREKMKLLYQPLGGKGTELLFVEPTSAELIKYAWNTFGALRIMYVNQLAQLCNAVDADVYQVVHAIAHSEQLLPTQQLTPGPGLGGSCFIKDAHAAVAMAKQQGVDWSIMSAVLAANEHHKRYVIDSVYQLLDYDVAGKTVALLGLSFKANTDDIRCSTACTMIEQLLADGAHVQAYDPHAIANMKRRFDKVAYGDSLYDAVRDADVVAVITEWDAFKECDLAHVATLVNQRKVVDARNIWDVQELRTHGFEYINLGKME